ncbi:hypothetical protein PLESTF_000388200 [Pleodorina starrii]|nr:hypothetical protein PLESTF_000388200 [Pleodorina starrii]
MQSHSDGISVFPFPWSAGSRAVDPLGATFGVPATVPGRRVLASVLDSATFRWAAIALAIIIGLLILAMTIWAIVTRCGRGRSSPVAPTTADGAARGADMEKGPAAAGGAGGVRTEWSPAHGPVAVMPPALQQLPSGYPPEAGYAADGGYAQLAGSPHLVQTPAAMVVPPPSSTGPVPPWRADPQRLPPGIMLAALTPPVYAPLVSNPRLASEPPYCRLVLISSRVHNPEMVARAVLPDVAYVVYDWKNFTLQELLRYVKKVLGTQKVLSVAVVAPGSKPGTVGLLEGCGTSPDKLATKSELSQFWRVLAGCVALSGGGGDGRRVDLLGCRVVEDPRIGAALLKELWNLTTVPFAAADDALGGYMLCTFMEEPTTRQLSLISSTIPAVDLYFDRYALLGIQPPGSAAPAAAAAGGGAGAGGAVAAAAARLPPGPPPPAAIVPVGTAPPLNAAVPAAAAAAPPPPQPPAPQAAAAPAPQAPAAPAPLPQAPQALAPLPQAPAALVPDAAVAAAAAAAAAPPPAPAPPPPAPASLAAPGGDVFSRLAAALAAHGRSPDAAFSEFDRDGSGQLSTRELTELMMTYLPDASQMDVKHFLAMLDTDALAAEQEQMLSRKEFVEGLSENVRIQEQVRAGRDDDEVVPRLQEYLTDNEQILRDTFEQFDENGDGHLDHNELQELVANIPGLELHEKKFIMALLYVHDANRDLRLSLDELLAALSKFGKHAAHANVTVARSLPQPLQLPPQAAPAPTAPLAPSAPAAHASVPPPEQQQQRADAAAVAPAAPAPAPLLPAPLPSALLAPLGPPGGKLAPLAPLGGLGGGAGALPRPGALAPLAPLPGR